MGTKTTKMIVLIFLLLGTSYFLKLFTIKKILNREIQSSLSETFDKLELDGSIPYEFSIDSRIMCKLRMLSTGDIFIYDELVATNKDFVVKTVKKMREIGLFNLSDAVLEWKWRCFPDYFPRQTRHDRSVTDALSGFRTVIVFKYNGECFYTFSSIGVDSSIGIDKCQFSDYDVYEIQIVEGLYRTIFDSAYLRAIYEKVDPKKLRQLDKEGEFEATPKVWGNKRGLRNLKH